MRRTADVVVIGGGVAGVSAAYFLAARADVVLVEAEPTLAYHTTGRSAALYIENLGETQVRHLTRASRPFLTRPPDGFSTGPLMTPRARLTIARADQVAALEAQVEQARRVGCAVSVVDGEAARALCPVLRPDAVRSAAVERDCADLDVHALHSGFTAGARARGARVLTAAPVRRLARSTTSWIIDAGDDHLEAPVVVDAAGAWADEVAASAGVAPVGLTPLRRSAFTVASPDGADTSAWPFVDDVGAAFYWKPEGSQILCSPADETPTAPGDARPETIDIARAIDAINAVTTLAIRHVRSSWAGLRTFAADREPVVGFDPDHPGFFWLAGQGGTGIQTAPATGRLAASLVLDGTVPDDLSDGGLEPGALAPRRSIVPVVW